MYATILLASFFCLLVNNGSTWSLLIRRRCTVDTFDRVYRRLSRRIALSSAMQWTTLKVDPLPSISIKGLWRVLISNLQDSDTSCFWLERQWRRRMQFYVWSVMRKRVDGWMNRRMRKRGTINQCSISPLLARSLQVFIFSDIRTLLSIRISRFSSTMGFSSISCWNWKIREGESQWRRRGRSSVRSTGTQ